MKQRKLQTILASAALAALTVLGSAPAAYADNVVEDNDVATAQGGNGGNGGIAVGVGVCAINVSLLAPAGCQNNGVGDASGGNGGDASAIADFN
ncbi:MAG: hypothetical protein ACRD0K_26185 [Egibacteraceae bacterium]